MTETDLIARLTRYTLCFNDRCPKGENCLRRMLARHNVPECKRISVVNPLCNPPEGEACEFFRSDRKLQIAWGFSKLYNDMPARIATAIHADWKADLTIPLTIATGTKRRDLRRRNSNTSGRYACGTDGRKNRYLTATPKSMTGDMSP